MCVRTINTYTDCPHGSNSITTCAYSRQKGQRCWGENITFENGTLFGKCPACIRAEFSDGEGPASQKTKGKSKGKSKSKEKR